MNRILKMLAVALLLGALLIPSASANRYRGYRRYRSRGRYAHNGYRRYRAIYRPRQRYYYYRRPTVRYYYSAYPSGYYPSGYGYYRSGYSSCY